VEAAAQTIASSAIVIGQNEVRASTTQRAFRIAREAGVPTLYNPAPFNPDIPAELYQCTHILVVNETEAGQMSGTEVNSPETAYAAGKKIQERGPQIVIVTLGAEGAAVIERNSLSHQPGVKVVAVDTTGAGDCFVGSFAHYFARGRSIAEAVRAANQVAAYSVQKPGTQKSYPSLNDLDSGLRT